MLCFFYDSTKLSQEVEPELSSQPAHSLEDAEVADSLLALAVDGRPENEVSTTSYLPLVVIPRPVG